MIILIEKRPIRVPAIKNSKDVQKVFEAIEKSFAAIGEAIADSNLIFVYTNWKLKEGWDDSMKKHAVALQKIRRHLDRIAALNSVLTYWLANAGQQQSTCVDPDTLGLMDLETKYTEDQIKFYYKAIKGTFFPKFDEEIKEHRNVVIRINENIDRINRINQSLNQDHRQNRPILNHIRNITVN
jgi:hypothetical protein